MKQTKLESILEQIINIGSGFIISYLMWKFIVSPLVIYEWLELNDSFIIVSMFTITSFIRSYIWRRFFNAELHKVIHNWSIKCI